MQVSIEELRSFRPSKWVIIGGTVMRDAIIPKSWTFDNERDARAQWDILIMSSLLPVAHVWEINADKDPMIRTLHWDWEEPF
jgi:hypothetical protein